MKKTNWAALAERVHQAAVFKGFYECEHPLTQSLILIITEIAEIVEADRKGWRAKVDEYKELGADAFNQCIKNSVEDEMADVALRLLDLCASPEYHCVMIDEYQWHYIATAPLKSISDTCFQMCKMITNCSENDYNNQIIYTIAYLFSRAELMGIDLMWFIEEKMKYNETRPYKHGKKY